MNRRGLSLVEVLVALAVVVTIFTPIFALMSTATLEAYRGGDRTVATIYANDVLEIIRGAPFDAFQAKDQWMSLREVLYEHNIPTGYELEKYEQRFDVQAKVSEVEGYPPQMLKQITVAVTYEARVRQRDAGGERARREVKLVSFYTPTQ